MEKAFKCRNLIKNEHSSFARLVTQNHNTKKREHVCLPVKRIFPAVKLRPQTPPLDKKEIGDAAIPGERRIHILLPQTPNPSTRAINQWARSLEWHHAVTLHILVGKICITFFPFSCEACSLYLVLWLYDYISILIYDDHPPIYPRSSYQYLGGWNSTDLWGYILSMYITYILLNQYCFVKNNNYLGVLFTCRSCILKCRVLISRRSLANFALKKYK